MSRGFDHDTALITGGTRGIGAAITRHLLDSGARVIITGRSEAPEAHELPEHLERVEYHPVDFRDSRSVELFARTMAARRIDLLVNNAGINRIALGGDIDLDDFDEIQTVNVRAPMVLARAILPGMADRGFGRVLNISSIFGVVSKSKRASYSTSKSALLGMTRALALDYAASGVLINALSPGFVDTELTRTVLKPDEIRELAASVPMRRLASPEEIAQTAIFLLSRENSFMTGQNIIVDGGFTCA